MAKMIFCHFLDPVVGAYYARSFYNSKMIKEFSSNSGSKRKRFMESQDVHIVVGYWRNSTILEGLSKKLSMCGPLGDLATLWAL